MKNEAENQPMSETSLNSSVIRGMAVAMGEIQGHQEYRQREGCHDHEQREALGVFALGVVVVSRSCSLASFSSSMVGGTPPPGAVSTSGAAAIVVLLEAAEVEVGRPLRGQAAYVGFPCPLSSGRTTGFNVDVIVLVSEIGGRE